MGCWEVLRVNPSLEFCLLFLLPVLFGNSLTNARGSQAVERSSVVGIGADRGEVSWARGVTIRKTRRLETMQS